MRDIANLRRNVNRFSVDFQLFVIKPASLIHVQLPLHPVLQPFGQSIQRFAAIRERKMNMNQA